MVGAKDSNVMPHTWKLTSNVHQLLRDFPKGHFLQFTNSLNKASRSDSGRRLRDPRYSRAIYLMNRLEAE